MLIFPPVILFCLKIIGNFKSSGQKGQFLETFILEDALGHVLTMRSGTLLNTEGWWHLICAYVAVICSCLVSWGLELLWRTFHLYSGPKVQTKQYLGRQYIEPHCKYFSFSWNVGHMLFFSWIVDNFDYLFLLYCHYFMTPYYILCFMTQSKCIEKEWFWWCAHS